MKPGLIHQTNGHRLYGCSSVHFILDIRIFENKLENENDVLFSNDTGKL